ncbi:hypothetical protein, partial [Corallococcus praedator]|uniref:hypothetical protein n=1 Tax=Corallococcus praedator TaxID=2316724 RepID=UPI001ABEFA38
VLEPEIILKISSQNPYQWTQPVIKLTLTSTSTRVPLIPKPQSFMNEARLTALALAIRLAMVGDKFKGIEGRDDLRILVIDDLLISLDMSNRMKVIKYLKDNPDFKNYQLIILTHDKGFFDILKNIFTKGYDTDKWKWFEMFDNGNLAS